MKPGTQENRMGICYPLFVHAYLFHLDFLNWSKYHQEAFWQNHSWTQLNEAALFKYSNLCPLDCLAMSTGSGNLVGCLCLSVNPSTDIAAAIILDLRLMSRMSWSAGYAVRGSHLLSFSVRSEYSVQLSLSHLPEKNFLKMCCRVEKNMRHTILYCT